LDAVTSVLRKAADDGLRKDPSCSSMRDAGEMGAAPHSAEAGAEARISGALWRAAARHSSALSVLVTTVYWAASNPPRLLGPASRQLSGGNRSPWCFLTAKQSQGMPVRSARTSSGQGGGPSRAHPIGANQAGQSHRLGCDQARSGRQALERGRVRRARRGRGPASTLTRLICLGFRPPSVLRFASN
jgi:hypothetical protein